MTITKKHVLYEHSLYNTSFAMEGVNPIPTGLGHVTLIKGLIPPLAGRNRVKDRVLCILLECRFEIPRKNFYSIP